MFEFLICVFSHFCDSHPFSPPPYVHCMLPPLLPPIPGKESVGVDASGPATRKTLLPAKGAESEKEGSRAKSAHSKLDPAHQTFFGVQVL